jgi:hypothetical protein
METVSFLIGSGFSKADGMPLASEINDSLINLTVDDIYIHSDMTLIRLKGEERPNKMIPPRDEHIVIDFIRFYCEKILNDSTEFDYEKVFDFIEAYNRFNNHEDEIHEFCEEFRSKHNTSYDDSNLIYRFSLYFPKLISTYLQNPRYYESISLGNYPRYDAFASYLNQLVNSGVKLNVHTLNHDLLFEHIASKHILLWQHFSDGFDELGSPYYGEVSTEDRIRKTYKVRLRQFTDNFNKNLCIYKLHGSIDTYRADISSRDETRIKKDWGVGNIYKEVYNDNLKKFEYKLTLQQIYPDFLSGTTSKITQYDYPFFKELIQHFEKNLEASNKLIVIGYGFKDEGINNILIRKYLSKGRPMTVIDKKIPDFSIINDFKTKKIEKPFIDVTFDEFDKI